MTEVKFFFNVDHKLAFACKLAKKAIDGGKRLIVFAPDEAMASEFNRMLWTFSPLSFVPHVLANHALANETPVVIANADSTLPHHDALLNLSDEPPPYFTRFEFLREIVSMDDNDRSKARERLKFYKSRGFDIQKLDMTAGK
ncbi:MAG: DNA polymerase III subunit chi [Pseudomonadota bacterium]